MLKLAEKIDKMSLLVGKFFSHFILYMVLVTFVVVVLRYVFSLGWIWLQETITYAHAIFFMATVSYTLLEDGHVRIDIFYQNYSFRKKIIINLIGTLFLLFPTIFLLFYYSTDYVFNSWQILEKSYQSEGLPFIYILKTFLLVFCILLFLQGLSNILKLISDFKK